MYYTGTKTKCEDYNNQVTLGEKYKSSTVRWMNPIKNYEGKNFAILKHDNYESDMTLIDKIPDGWFNNTEL
jgi:hypothetical protein